MNEVVPQDRRPAAMGRNPVIESLDQVQHALRLLAWFHSRESTLAATEAQADRLREIDRAKERNLVVDGETLTFAQYGAELEAAIREHCKRRPELFAQARTVDFPAGTIALRRKAWGIELIEGTPTENLAAIVKREGLAAKIVGWVKRLKLWPFIRMKPEFNLSEIKAAFAAEKITEKDLKRYGFRHVPAHDEIVITPAARSSTAAGAAAAEAA